MEIEDKLRSEAISIQEKFIPITSQLSALCKSVF